MTEFYRMFAGKDSMYLWNPYLSWRIALPKTTETGIHETKIMLSCGRMIKDDINKEKFEKLPQRTQDKIVKKHTLETFLRPEITFKNRVLNNIVKSYLRLDKKARQILGIQGKYDADRNVFEIFQFIKFRNMDEMLPMALGYSRSLGVMARISRMQLDDMKKLIRKQQIMLHEGFWQGYNIAKEKDWR